MIHCCSICLPWRTLLLACAAILLSSPWGISETPKNAAEKSTSLKCQTIGWSQPPMPLLVPLRGRYRELVVVHPDLRHRGAMKAHEKASRGSKDLCDQLFDALQKAIPKLQRAPNTGSCGLFQEGRTRFAYVYHSKAKSRIEIWCRGDVDTLMSQGQGLGVTPRKKQDPGWAQEFPARFQIHSGAEIEAAARFLTDVSFAASTPKSYA